LAERSDDRIAVGDEPARHGWPRAVRRYLTEAIGWLTTPLHPDDYVRLINPLWSTRGLRARVEDVRPETGDTATVVLRPGRGWTGHRAGQHVRVGVDLDGVWHWRPFSLSSPPTRPDGCVTVTVKANRRGHVSPYLVRQTRPGTIVRLTPAQGQFVLPDEIPQRILFLTAGSGITPVASILRDLAARGDVPDTVMVHCAPTPADVIFGDEIRVLAARFPSLRLHERHTRVPGGRPRLTMAELARICPDWRARHTWACGPAGMLDDAETQWRRADLSERLHVERFHPPLGSRGRVGGRVRFTASRREVDARGATPLLAVGELAGVLMPSGCRMGICYSCVAALRSGRVRDLRTGQVHGAEGDLIQTCVSAAAGPVEIDL
jgi:stearoyl-CoA 9-desaturase NADPH oxidoreductase